MHIRYFNPKVIGSFRWTFILTIRGLLLGFFCDLWSVWGLFIFHCRLLLGGSCFYSHFTLVLQKRCVLQDFFYLTISLLIRINCVVCCLKFRMVQGPLNRRALHIPARWPYFVKLFNLTHTRKMFWLAPRRGANIKCTTWNAHLFLSARQCSQWDRYVLHRSLSFKHLPLQWKGQKPQLFWTKVSVARM